MRWENEGREKGENWKKWFAWYPVLVFADSLNNDGELDSQFVWWEYVERWKEKDYDISLSGVVTFPHYRFIKELTK